MVGAPRKSHVFACNGRGGSLKNRAFSMESYLKSKY